MKIELAKHLFFSVFASCLLSISTQAQNGSVTVSQDPKFEQLLNEKRRINASITVNDKYKVQIYNGDSENSKKILADFRKDFKQLDATVVFSTPAYKVWVGNFKSRIEAERNLVELRKKYPNAIIVKPNK
ncbi:SPOR domain-containing protein [Flavobacterium selenitireducens]|uniref:SPOR domain-containing protein n=1 Tax=Flavobacterium selenitireducens TaxID=2722704 RepID=UPI00168A4293|nr:SPOR domain-containing protein [Flavobacterium selenitireducens]MBD3582358.1 SPOR domain-containing protein [Flavobacterium selenitireducens]